MAQSAPRQNIRESCVVELLCAEWGVCCSSLVLLSSSAFYIDSDLGSINPKSAGEKYEWAPQQDGELVSVRCLGEMDTFRE